jgi:hypothetical protein
VVGTRGVAFANVLWAAQMAQFAALGLPCLFSRHVQPGRLLGPRAVRGGLEREEEEYRAAGDGAA